MDELSDTDEMDTEEIGTEEVDTEEMMEDIAERGKAWENRMREFFARLKHPRLRIFVETFYDFQKLWMATHSRRILYDKFGLLTPLQSADLLARDQELKIAMGKIMKLIEDELKGVPVYVQYLEGIKGIKTAMGGGFIAWIDNPARFRNPSKLWTYAGFGVEVRCKNCDHLYFENETDRERWVSKTVAKLTVARRGKKISEERAEKKARSLLCRCESPKPHRVAQKRRKGEPLSYNPRLKNHCWKAGGQLLKAKNPTYDPIYREKRAEYEARPDIKAEHQRVASSGRTKSARASLKGYRYHIHHMAMRPMMKRFLTDLLTRWRELEGLPVTKPYAIAKLGHKEDER